VGCGNGAWPGSGGTGYRKDRKRIGLT